MHFRPSDRSLPSTSVWMPITALALCTRLEKLFSGVQYCVNTAFLTTVVLVSVCISGTEPHAGYTQKEQHLIPCPNLYSQIQVHHQICPGCDQATKDWAMPRVVRAELSPRAAFCICPYNTFKSLSEQQHITFLEHNFLVPLVVVSGKWKPGQQGERNHSAEYSETATARAGVQMAAAFVLRMTLFCGGVGEKKVWSHLKIFYLKVWWRILLPIPEDLNSVLWSQYYIKVGCFAECYGHQNNLPQHNIIDDIKAKDKIFAETVDIL